MAQIDGDLNGVVVNLMQGNHDSRNLPPYSLDTSTVQATFQVGVYYVLSLTGSELISRGSDSSSSTSVVDKQAPEGHTYVGAMMYPAAMTTVSLYAKLP